MAITGNDLLKKLKGSTNEDNKSNGTNSKIISGEDLLKRRKTYNTIDTQGVDQKYIDTFVNDANTFLTTAEKDYGDIGWANASSLYDSRNTAWQDLNTRADTIGAWLYKNRDSLDRESYDNISTTLEGIRSNGTSVIDLFKGAADNYSQWETEEDYKAAIAEAEKAEADRGQYGANQRRICRGRGAGWPA